ncbi:MAG: c-type cytochrome [Candidatus Poribacteria bacterium]|nr:c-type cytochrome [Candidatus Poribacteria bacterium]
MKRFYGILVLFTAFGITIFSVLAQRSSQPPAANDDTHPLAQGVRIIVPPSTESAPAPQQPRDWGAIIQSLGLQPDTESCADCHFEGSSPTQAHPGNHLSLHPPETFGCVLCHGGDAQSTEQQAAHTSTEAFPFLNRRQVEANCGKCHTEPAVPGAHSLSGGRFVLNRYGCVTCHNLPVEIPVERYAPRLDTIGNKVTKAWLQRWLEDTTLYLPESKMPNIDMSADEREAIVAFLLTLRNDAFFQPIAGAGNAENGRKIFVDNECQSCHTLHGKGDPIGPELERVGIKVNRLWLTNYLRSPAAFHPNTKMPDYEFSDQDILDVTEYLLSNFSAGKPVLDKFSDVSSEPSRAREGFKFYISKGCAQCHGITRYMKVNITGQLRQWDIQEAVNRIQAHRGQRIEVPEIDIPESDLELMEVALRAMRQDEIYKALTYNLAEGTLGHTDRFLEAFWRFPIPMQGETPDAYNEKVAALDPEACGSCHTKQWEDWKTSRHAIAMGPGIWGQLVGTTPGFVESCSQCHAPLSEQHEYLPTSDGEYAANRRYDAQLQSHGLACAVCHVRGHQRFGPPFSETEAAAGVLGEGHHGGAVVSRAYQDSAFCKPCHQFDADGFGLNGKLLENTYNEWRQSPHARDGQTCQSCHMPDRQHRWRGIHDPETVRKAVKLKVQVKNKGESIEADIQVTNEGAGHHLPTYVTPAIFVTVRLLDAFGNPIPDTEQVRVIQRRVPLSLDRELFDTRIPAGGTWAYTYQASRPKQAATLDIRIDVQPDHFYNGFFKAYRASSPGAQQYINDAFQTTEESPYLLLTRQIPLE